LVTAAALLAATAIAAWYSYPYFSFSERFRRSKPALEQWAAQFTATGSTDLNAPCRIGYFKILKVETLPHGFILQHNAGNPFDWNGLAYSTELLPREEKNTQGEVRQIFTPLEGNWYDVFRARP